MMDSSLLVFAADILGDTASGLTGSKIAKYCVGYSIEYNIKIMLLILFLKMFLTSELLCWKT